MSDIRALWLQLAELSIAGPQPTLLYCADPMCSWCWGFSPVLEAVARDYGSRLQIEVLVGGLRAGHTRPTDARFREEIFGHWRAVAATTGQSFNYEGALPDGFVYDTEPACRAVVTVREIAPTVTLAFLHRLHHAFYMDQRDVTAASMLASLAASVNVDSVEFSQRFASRATQERTERHFALVRELGVRGFPTVLVADGERISALCTGYQSYANLAQSLEWWLAGA